MEPPEIGSLPLGLPRALGRATALGVPRALAVLNGIDPVAAAGPDARLLCY
jgi:hypothetical protein